MDISREEFLDWKSQAVTKEVFKVIDERINDAKDELSASAGDDPVADRYLVGMIRAFRELQDINYED